VYREPSYQFGTGFTNTLRPEEFDADLKMGRACKLITWVWTLASSTTVSGSVDAYYHRTRRRTFAVVPVPAGANLSDQLVTNVGETVSKGIEVGLNGGIIQNR
jgi:TonB-dependent starch-binding outer membrane protein SusC